MSQAIDVLKVAFERALRERPKVGGFPVLAEILREAGVTRNLWYLPSCQSVFLTKHGNVINQGDPLEKGMLDVPAFDEAALIHALRTDQAGEGTFPEFLVSAWKAGVIRYEVDFAARNVSYYGAAGEVYVETYPAP